MGTVPWRCEHPTTKDVKLAVRPAHKVKLEAKGYVCVLKPDLKFKVLKHKDPTSTDGS